MQPMLPLLSVVVPVYKAEDCLNELYIRVKSSVESFTHNFELVLIDDASADKSWQVIERLSKIDSRVRGVKFSRNFGQHYAITAGLDVCKGDWTIVMDCDLQDSPEEIPRLYAKALEGYDVVLARRGVRNDPLIKRAVSRLFYKVFNYLADLDYDGDSGNFRIISRKVVDNLRKMNEQLRFFGGLVQWMGFSTTSIEVTHAKRFAGKSTYTYAKLWKLATETIIAHSDKPLRLTVRFGFVMALLSLCFGLYVLARAFLYGSAIAGWSSLIISVYFIGGIIIAILGMLGIYVGKTFDESKKRPLYIVDKTTSDAFAPELCPPVFETLKTDA